jgi:tetratricopeptide (TPR) repeat protein
LTRAWKTVGSQQEPPKKSLVDLLKELIQQASGKDAPQGPYFKLLAGLVALAVVMKWWLADTPGEAFEFTSTVFILLVAVALADYTLKNDRRFVRILGRILLAGVLLFFIVRALGAALPGLVQSVSGFFRLPVAVLPFEPMPGVASSDEGSTELLNGLLGERLERENRFRLVPMDIAKLLADTLPTHPGECLDRPLLEEVRRSTGAVFVMHGAFREARDGRRRLAVCLQRTGDGETLGTSLRPAPAGREGLAGLVRDLVSWLNEKAKARFLAQRVGLQAGLHGANEHAVRLYLEGLWNLKRYALRDARKKLELALEVDPSFFQAHLALSRTWRELGHYANALKEAEVAQRLFPKVRDELGPQDEIRLKAYRLTAMSRWDGAIGAHRALWEMSPSDANLACQLVEAQNLGGRGADALATVHEIRDRVQAGTLFLPHPFDARLDIEEATANLIVGRADCQWEAALRAVDKLMRTPDVLLEARARYLQCDALVKKGGADFALCEEARDRFQRREDLIGYGRLLQVSAQWFSNRNDLKASAKFEREALHVFEEGTFYQGWVDQLSNLSYTESLRGQGLEARKLCDQALRLARIISSPKEPRIILNCAYFSVMAGEYPEALTQYSQSIEAARRTGDMMMETVALGNLAYMHHKLGNMHHQPGDLERARVQYEDAVALSRNLKETGWEFGETLLRYARLLCDLGRDGSARSVFVAGQKLYHGPQRSEQVADSLAAIDKVLGSGDVCWKRLMTLPLPPEESTVPVSCEPEVSARVG